MPNQVPTPAPWEYRPQPGMTLMRLSLRQGKGEALAVDLGALAPDGGCCKKPSAKTRAALAVTVAEGPRSSEAGQGAPRASDDLLLFRTRP
jgi:hypothetical protein